MANFVVEHLQLPPDMQFRVVKTQLAVLWGDIIETADDRFNPMYFESNEAANRALASLIDEAHEPIIGLDAFEELLDQDVAEWMLETGRFPPGAPSPEAAFRELDTETQAVYRIDYVTAKAQAELDLKRGSNGNCVRQAPTSFVYQPKWENLTFLEDLPTLESILRRYYKADRIASKAEPLERLVAMRTKEVAATGYGCVASACDTTYGHGIFIKKSAQGFHVFAH